MVRSLYPPSHSSDDSDGCASDGSNRNAVGKKGNSPAKKKKKRRGSSVVASPMPPAEAIPEQIDLNHVNHYIPLLTLDVCVGHILHGIRFIVHHG